MFGYLLLIALIAVYILYQRKQKHLPKGYKPFDTVKIPHTKTRVSRNRYKLRKVEEMEEIDYIVIGSGIGSLTVASVLAKMGKKCLVLEQHDIAGGTMHCFEDKGYEFDTGIHYVGKGKSSTKFMVDLIADEPVEWHPLGNEENGYVFDNIVVNDEEFPLRPDTVNYRNDLVKRFPEEEQAIDGFIEAVRVANKSLEIFFFAKLFHPTIRDFVLKYFCKTYLKYSNVSISDVLDEFTKNEKLRTVLSAQFGDLGLPPSELNFVAAASVLSHYYREGGFYPVGGPQVIPDQIIPTILKAGGAVLVKAPVQEILIDQQSKTAYGVLMENGDQIISNFGVISGAGLKNTYEKFIREDIATNLGLEREVPVKQGVSHISVFLGLEGTPEELGLESYNHWVLPTGDRSISQMCHDFYADPLKGDMLLFVGSPSAKDPTFQDRYPGKSTLVALTEAKHEWFSEFDENDEPRSEGYMELKEKLGKRVLEGVKKLYPSIEGKIRYMDIGSPFTNTFYLGSPQGASYGLEMSFERATSNSRIFDYQVNGLNGLYITGQDICSPGFTGALMGGYLTAHTILNYGFYDLMILNRNLITDLKNLNDTTLQ